MNIFRIILAFNYLTVCDMVKLVSFHSPINTLNSNIVQQISNIFAKIYKFLILFDAEHCSLVNVEEEILFCSIFNGDVITPLLPSNNKS